jgi:hypothetical protein
VNELIKIKQSIRIDISPEKIWKWPTSMCKDAQYHSSSASNPQGDLKTHLLGWPSSKRQMV